MDNMFDKIGGFFEKTDLELDIKNKKKEMQKLKSTLGEVLYEQDPNHCQTICPEIVLEIRKIENEIAEINRKIEEVDLVPVCEKCKKPIAKDSKFCNYCGTPVVVVKKEPQKVCPSCGKEVDTGALFCIYCGTPLGHDITAEEVVVKKCVNCGAELDDDSAFCMSCGTEIK